jgi:hypothetical protein
MGAAVSHRTAADAERVRRAHAPNLDPEVADRVMSREFRTDAPRDRDVWDRQPVADPAAVARLSRDIARDAVIPAALAVACGEHEAAPGVYCYRGVRGVCAARIDGRNRHA